MHMVILFADVAMVVMLFSRYTKNPVVDILWATDVCVICTVVFTGFFLSGDGCSYIKYPVYIATLGVLCYT